MSSPYIDGLNAISKQLGYTSIPEMLCSLDESKIATLKEWLQVELTQEYKKFEDEISDAEDIN